MGHSAIIVLKWPSVNIIYWKYHTQLLNHLKLTFTDNTVQTLLLHENGANFQSIRLKIVLNPFSPARSYTSNSAWTPYESMNYMTMESFVLYERITSYIMYKNVLIDPRWPLIIFKAWAHPHLKNKLIPTLIFNFQIIFPDPLLVRSVWVFFCFNRNRLTHFA